MSPASDIKPDAPREFELLLRLLSQRGEVEGLRESLKRVADWDRLFRLASRHKVLAQLYAALAGELRDEVPGVAFGELEVLVRDNARRNLLFTARLLKLLELLADEGVEAVPFKGPLLALSAYGDSSMRQFGDLDLLVRPADVPRAGRVLVSQGYAPQFTLSDSQERRLVGFRNEHTFSHEGEGVVVDLHWTLSPRWLHDDAGGGEVWTRLESVTVGGRRVPTLGRDDLLLFLCAHGSKHCWSQVGMPYDLATLLRAAEPDWPMLFREARRQGSTRMLLLGLHMASTLFGVALPAEAAKLISADRKVDRLACEAHAKLRRDPDEPWGFFEESRFNLKVIERARTKALYYLDLLATPTPREWELVRLPDRLFFLYYLVRPVRLVLKHTGRI
jgi:hypothetical protein